MAKNQFADKTSKAASKKRICPVCNSDITPVMVVASDRSPRSGSVKFSQRLIKVCKCNEKEVYV